MVWRRCGCENILLQRWKIMVSRGRNLSDSYAETWKHPWFHCCWQQRYFQSNRVQQIKFYVYYQRRINNLFVLIRSPWKSDFIFEKRRCFPLVHRWMCNKCTRKQGRWVIYSHDVTIASLIFKIFDEWYGTGTNQSEQKLQL